MTIEELHKELLANQDTGYAEFTQKLGAPTPTRPYLGVRVPILRKLTKQIAKESPITAFLQQLPHKYADEFLLHAILINSILAPAALIQELNQFLPAVDTWCICDTLSPTLFKKDPNLCLTHIPIWIESPHSYTQRFAVHMLLVHCTKKLFTPYHLDWLTALPHSKEVDTAIAWYLAEALVDHPNEIYNTIASSRFAPAIRLAAIQKANESRRIPTNLKTSLKQLRPAVKNAN